MNLCSMGDSHALRLLWVSSREQKLFALAHRCREQTGMDGFLF